jgi:cAMP-dependent protein kinase regulator
LEILPEKIENKYKKGPRGSVSAEAFGVHNKKGDFKAHVIPKSQETRNKIVARLNMAFMF